jgi:ABC-type spermidine/putrescine transport system permease subunit II
VKPHAHSSATDSTLRPALRASFFVALLASAAAVLAGAPLAGAATLRTVPTGAFPNGITLTPPATSI